MALALVYIMGQLNPPFMLVFSNIILLATSCVAVLFSFLILNKYTGRNPKPMFSMAWVGISSGLFLWFLGGLVWVVYALFLNVNPFPSFADVLFVAGYFPLFLALFLVLKVFQTDFSKKKLMLQIGFTIGLSAVISYLLLVPISNSGKTPLVTALSAAYPILDIGLFAPAFVILLIFFEGSIGKAWFFLILGIILNIIADLFFTYTALQGFYHEGHPVELFFLWGYVAFLLGFHIHRREL
jgi:hypothetical protein